VVVEPGVRTGISVRHDNPKDLGADRIANAVAAQALYGGPAIVVDFGTAISFDVLDRDGTFVGGAIAPGVSTYRDALVEHAARLPTVETVPPPSAIGRSTVTALQSGLVFGFAGLVDGIVARIGNELGPGVTTVATGGLAASVLQACTSLDHHDPWLTLKGLRLVWERNLEG
jgi:type III pantothenate kinase